jgi:N-acetyl-gamma-glutamyl-phosphate reductase
MTDRKVRIAILGASGYTGAELLRLLVRHPGVEITALTADRKAGQPLADVFPQFVGLNLPTLVTIAELDLDGLDLVFCALPHGTTQTVIADLLARKPDLKVIDLSADFRLADPQAYARWYGHEHQAMDLQGEAVYGIAELYRAEIRKARLIANPGCHSSTAILAGVPLLRAGLVDADDIVTVSSTGMSGAGRAAREEMLFSEVSEGLHAYGVGSHRHTAELDQEFSRASGRPVMSTFTAQLAPMNRGIYSMNFFRPVHAAGAPELHAALSEAYADEPFIELLPLGKVPQSRHARGSNRVLIGVVPDRRPDRVVVISTCDNLVKGASGSAVQNMNVLCGFAETDGLPQVALFP